MTTSDIIPYGQGKKTVILHDKRYLLSDPLREMLSCYDSRSAIRLIKTGKNFQQSALTTSAVPDNPDVLAGLCSER